MPKKTSVTAVLLPRTIAGVIAGIVLAVLTLLPVFNPTRGGVLRTRVAEAATSSTLNFQARIYSSAGNVVPDGYYNVEFKLYDVASGGSALWTDTRYDTNGVTAGNDFRLRVVNGYFSVNLADTTVGGTAFPSTINWDQELWLTMNIGGSAQTATPTWDGEMSPRIKLTAVPYAFQAGTALGVSSNSTSTAATNTNGVTVTTGNSTTSGNTGGLTLSTGNATSGNSGNVAIDTGTASGTTGNITLGASNASAITLGRAGITTTIQGSVTIDGGTNYGIYYRDGSGNLATTAAGSSGECFRAVTGAAPVWGSCSGTGDVIQNGNVFGATMRIGTNDAFDLQLEVNDTIALTIDDTTLATTLVGDLAVNGDDITADGNLTINAAGTVTIQDNLVVTGSAAFNRGTDYSTTGSQNDVDFGSVSLVRLTGASAQTITGIANGTDGELLTIVNAASQAATLTDNDGASSAANRIITGTGASLSLPAGASISLVYDSASTVWRVTGSASGVGGFANTALSNLSGVSINTSLLPNADNTLDLGSAGNSWRTLYADTSVLTGAIDTPSAGTLAIGNTNATALSLCNSAACDTIQIGTNNDADTISIGDANDTTGIYGTITLQGNTDVAATASLAVKAGTLYATAGAANNVAISTASLYIMDTSGAAQTLTGIAAGRDGQMLTLVNASGSQVVTLNNEDTNSNASNRIVTGTGAAITIPVGGAQSLIYDSVSSRWRVVGTSAVSGGFANRSLSNLASVAINTALLPGADNTIDLGSAGFSFRTLYADTSVLAPALDTAAAGTLGLGTSTATAITIGRTGITTTNAGALTVTELLTGSAGLTVTGGATSISGGTISLNASSNNNTDINTGTSTGTVTIGNGSAGAVSITSGTSIGLTGTTNVAGVTTINDNANNNTNINTGTSTGIVTIGGGAGTFSLQTTNIDISTTGGISGVTDYAQASGNFAISGAGTFSTGTGAISLNGNTTVTGTGTFSTGSGTVTLQGNTNVAATVSLATQAGTTYTTAGSANDVAVSTASLYILDTSGAAQVLTGIVAGRDGQQLTLVNADTSNTVTLNNEDTNSSAANRIITGTGSAVAIPAGGSISLIYDSTNSRWRVIGSSAVAGGYANQSLSNLSSVAINTSLLPNADNTLDLGSAAFAWRSLYADTSVLTAAIDTPAAGALTIGNSNATSVSICNSAACDTIEIGNNADADTLTIGDSTDTIGINGTTTITGNTTVSVGNTTSLQVTGSRADDGALQAVNLTLTNDANTDIVQALAVNVTSANTGDIDILQGIGINDLTSPDATVLESALYIGGGWDAQLYLGDTTNQIVMADGATLTIGDDALNDFFTFTDDGTTGSFSANGGITAGGLLTGNLGATVSGAAISLNASSNFNTNINTGTSTGAVAIGNSAAGAITIQSGSTVGLTGTTTITGLASGDALVVNNSTSTGNIFVAQDNGSPVFTIANGGAITATGTVLLQGNTDIDNTASLATQAGTTYTTAGSANDVAISTASLYILDTSGAAQTITGIVAGRDGQMLTLVNADATNSVTLTNEDAGSSASNRLLTGTGAAVTIPANGSVSLIYDSTNSRWRVIGSTATAGGYANTALSNLANVAINTALLPGADNTIDLGSAAFSFRTLYADTSVLTPSVDVASAGTLTIGNTTATAVSICNSAACDTIEVGNNADADTITIGDASDTVGINGITTFGGTVANGANNSLVRIGGTVASTGADLMSGMLLNTNFTVSTSSDIDLFGGYFAPTTSTNNLDTGTASLSGLVAFPTYSGTGTLNNLFGALVGAANTSTGTVDEAAGLYVSDAVNAGTINYNVGIDIENRTGAATSNINLLIAPTSGAYPTGNYSIYSNSAYDSLFAGKLRVGGTTAPTATLDVTGSITASGLITGNLGATVSGAAISLNASSNFNTNINTGTSTGAVAIGNSAAGAITIQSGSTVGVTGTTTITGRSTGDALTVNNSTSTGAIFVAQDNGTPVFSILDGGNVLQAANGYYNFGTTSGSTGYGIRDNNGVLEVKDSNGCWYAINGGGCDAVVVPTLAATTTVTGGTSTSTVLTVPSGTADGDLLLAVITTYSATVTPPAGWTLHSNTFDSRTANSTRVYVYYRIASGDIGGTTTHTFTHASIYRSGSMMRIVNASTSTPIHTSATRISTADGQIGFPAVTTSIASTLGIGIASSFTDQHAATTINNWTQNTSYDSNFSRIDTRQFINATTYAAEETAITETDTYVAQTIAIAPGTGAAQGNANRRLSNLDDVAINTSLLPGVTSSIDLGSSSQAFRNLYLADTTTTGTLQTVTANSLTTGVGINVTSSSTGLTSGSLIRVSSATTGAVATNGIVSLTATGNYTSTSNAGLLNVAANSTTAGTVANISGNALTTGVGVNIGSTGTGLTTGSLLRVSTATTGAVATNGVVNIQATGNYTSTSNVGVLSVQANSTTAGTIANINGNALTTGVGLYLGSTSTGMTTGSLLYGTTATTGAVATNGIFSLNATGNYTSTSNTGLLNVAANATAAGTVANFSGNALTTGVGVNIASTGTGLTTGSLLRISTATTGAVATNGVVNIQATGNYTSTSNVGVLSVQANTTTAGTVANFNGNALTTGVGVYIGSTGTGLTSGSLLNVTSATTGAVATNGIISLNATGNYTSTSNVGLLQVNANSTTAGTIATFNGNALTTGVGVRIASTGTGLTTGSLLQVSTATTGAVATNGVVSIQATGAYTSTSNAGLLNVSANSTTTGTIVNIQGTSLNTTGTALNINAGAGRAVNSVGTAVFQTSTNTTTAFQIQNSASASLFTVDTTNNYINVLGNNSAELTAFSTNGTGLGEALKQPGVAFYNGYVYTLGGDNSGAQSDVYYARVNADGSLSSFSATTSLPAARSYGTAAAHNGYLYFTGGSSTATYYARLNADGTVGTWQTGTVLPEIRTDHSTLVYNGYIYVILGESSGAARGNGYYARLNADGSIGSWSTTTSLPSAATRYDGAVTIANGHIYATGGQTGGSAQDDVYYAPVNTDGSIGTWVLETDLMPENNNAPSQNAHVLNGYIYVLGGATTTSAAATVDKVYYAPLNADGSTGAWSTVTNRMPAVRLDPISFTANGYLYVLGGANASDTQQSTVYYASVPRVRVGGSLDLVGYAGENLLNGGSGGTLTAGNTNVVGTLQVQQAAYFRDTLGVSGDVNTGRLGVTGDITLVQGANRTVSLSSRPDSGTGYNLTIQGGSAGTGSNNGGNLILTAGAGSGAGVRGLVVLDTASYSTATLQSSATSVAITQANIDTYGAILLSATASGVTFTMGDPTITTAGRVIYITNAGSNDFTLSVNGGGTGNTITLKPNTTATMYWNGSDWTAAGASSSTDLQAAYNNTATSAGGAELVLNAPGGSADGLTIRNNGTTPITGGLLEVQTSIGSNLFTVNNNATEYATNGGAETAGGTSSTFPASTWDTTGGGTISRYTTAGNFVATGQASVSMVTSAQNHGARNRISSSLTSGLTYTASFAVRGTTNFTNLEVRYSPDGTTSGTTLCGNASYTVTSGQWTRIDCDFTASGTITSSNSMLIRYIGTSGFPTFYIDNLSINVDASTNFAGDGSADNVGAFATNWGDYEAGAVVTVAQETSVIYEGSASARAIITPATANVGIRNNMGVTPAVSTQFLISFYARSTTTMTGSLAVGFLPAGGTGAPSGTAACVDYNTQSLVANTWTKITCLLTTSSSGISNPDLVIYQTDTAARTIYVDDLSITLNTNNSSNVQIGGGNKGGPVTLFTLDRSNGNPIADNNDAYLGSMYYDTSTGRIQCYEADGWGACGAAPDNIVNLNPEYAGAVLNGTGVGTMTADFCANQAGVLQVNYVASTDPCFTSGDVRNYYRWTSPQATQQTYSIYVTYQLPATFNGFSSDDTVQLTGRVTDTTNASVTYQMYKSVGGTLTQCGTGETDVITGGGGAANTWYTYGINGNEATGCSFSSSAASGFLIFKINMKANSNASAYVSTLSFTTTGR